MKLHYPILGTGCFEICSCGRRDLAFVKKVLIEHKVKAQIFMHQFLSRFTKACRIYKTKQLLKYLRNPIAQGNMEPNERGCNPPTTKGGSTIE